MITGLLRCSALDPVSTLIFVKLLILLQHKVLVYIVRLADLYRLMLRRIESRIRLINIIYLYRYGLILWNGNLIGITYCFAHIFRSL